MANVLTAVVPQLLAQGLMVLREVSMLPKLVNRGYETLAGEKGSTIQIPISSAIPVQDVIPAPTPPTTASIAPTMVNVVLDRWKEAAFYLTDKEQMEVMAGFIPLQAKEAIKSLANIVNRDLLLEYVNFYGFAGTPGITPFATDTSEATEVRKILNVQLAPMDNRYLVIDPEAEANALNLRAIQDQSWRIGLNQSSIVNGQISRTLGFDWFMHQLVPLHTAGTVTGTITTTANAAAGAQTVALGTDAGEAIALVVGDIVTFAGHTQTYVVNTALTVGASSGGTLVFSPGLKVAVASGTAITVKASHTANLAFHRDAIAFATRPLQNGADGLGSIVQAAVDPDSGLSLRLEVSRQHKQTRWSFDILYGVKTVRPEFGARLAG